jgi:NAD(P)-dependent dehydrogenase (short-subunit alcohol dehydrogenase family)
MPRLAGKVAIVTGGALGLGRVYALRFLREGPRVAIADIADPADAVRDLEKHGEVIGVRTDVASAASTPMLLHYVTSKGAVIAMTRALARELGEWGIGVNAVAPGLILSDTVRANPDVTGFQSAAVMAARSFKRDAVGEDVEGAVLFLASDDSAFMTGQTLVVDGGSVFT